MNIKFLILIIILLIILVKTKKFNKKKENFETKNELFLFYSFKSDYSMSIIPIWQKLKQLKIKNSNLEFIDVNTDKLNYKLIEKIKNINVNSVPNIYLKKNDVPIKYNGNFTLKSIISFLKLNSIFINHSLLVLE